MNSFHFLRPWWLLLFFLLLLLSIRLFKQVPKIGSWSSICDKTLLDSLLVKFPTPRRFFSKILLFLSASFMIIGLAGPTWTRLPVPTYSQIQPKIFLLDLSNAMLQKDVSPSRLERAKFILYDTFNKYKLGQFGLIAYTSEPFVVSPLTDDVQTIQALLSPLHPNIVPVGGQDLGSALNQAVGLIKQANYAHGQIIVLTANPPNSSSISIAKDLAQKRIFTSVMPIYENKKEMNSFEKLATAGQGKFLHFSKHSKELLKLFSTPTTSPHLERQEDKEIPIWRDEGRWFLLPALLFLLPTFRKGWLQRVF